MTTTAQSQRPGPLTARPGGPSADGSPPANAPLPTPPPAPIPLERSVACIAASVLLWLTQGLGMNLVAVNIYQIQGTLGATLTETSWLVAAYMAPNVSLTILLMKIRTQFGLRRFAEISIGVFVAVSLLHLAVRDLESAVTIRFVAGMAAAPMSTLGFLYMLDAFPPARKMTWGLCLALTCSTATPTVARMISPAILDMGQMQGLYTLEIGLSLMALATVFLLPLTPVPHAKVIHRLDFASYPLVAVGFGALAVVLVLGRFYWWFEAPWIGVLLAVAVLSIALAAAIELNRETPLINIRWLMSPEIVRFAVILVLLRVVLAEQTSGAYGLFQAIGLLNEHSVLLYAVILLASMAGGVFCAMLLTSERVSGLHCLALACIAAGAYLDGHATNLTRPADMYVSQALIAFGGALFLPPALLVALTKTLRQGPTYITSFVVVFLFTQSIGGLLGSAVFGTFVTLREKLHSNYLVEHARLTDPLVAARVSQLSAAYGRALADKRLLDAEGLALLSQQVTREATILAYNDAFLAVFAVAAVTLTGFVLKAGYDRVAPRIALLLAHGGADRAADGCQR